MFSTVKAFLVKNHLNAAVLINRINVESLLVDDAHSAIFILFE